IGLLIIYSSSSVPAYQKFGDSFHFLRKQALFAGLGFFVILVCQRIPYRWIDVMTLPLLVLSMLLLAATHLPYIGIKANGASRWVNLGLFTFQPAELAKLALILFLSKNLARSKSNVTNLKGLTP